MVPYLYAKNAQKHSCFVMGNKYRKPIFLNQKIDDSHRLQFEPQPVGNWPYHLPIERILPRAGIDMAERMVFHVIGDTGSLRPSRFQSIVSREISKQVQADQSAFLYHLGDIVYDHGEASEYARQFFRPYEHYPGAIFALAGNHDADINPDSDVMYQSLDAFMDVFCDSERRDISFSGGSRRKSMIQPNVYWTLETPLANFIGLYPNVTKYGWISKEQEEWFEQELLWCQAERESKALIVCLHHAPYSADTNHGSSAEMIVMLERAFERTGVKPDLVLSGHVHNYQRFSKRYEDGTVVPYIVAGAGGYDGLHSVAMQDDPAVSSHWPVLETVHLENYCDDRYGFMNLTLEKGKNGLFLTGAYYTIAPEAAEDDTVSATLFERFVMPLRMGQPRMLKFY